MSKIVFAAASVSLGPPTHRVRLKLDEPWWADDPFVVANPHLFRETPSERTIRGVRPPSDVVEQATAAPGEKRTSRR